MDKAKMITYLKQTCFAYPAEWEGKLGNGHMIYVRYRHGCFTLSESPVPTDDIDEAVDGEVVIDLQYGEHLDGEMSFDELIQLIAKYGFEFTKNE